MMHTRLIGKALRHVGHEKVQQDGRFMFKFNDNYDSAQAAYVRRHQGCDVFVAVKFLQLKWEYRLEPRCRNEHSNGQGDKSMYLNTNERTCSLKNVRYERDGVLQTESPKVERRLLTTHSNPCKRAGQQ
jgi:hypothetical protein